MKVPDDIKGLLEELDVEVLLDQEADNEGNEDDMRTHPIYALGWKPGPAAGITGGPCTPWFKTHDELWAYCRTRANDLRRQYIPDYEEDQAFDERHLEAYEVTDYDVTGGL